MQFESNLFTTAEAAVYLRCSSSKIYQLLHKKELSAIKNGNGYLIPRELLDAYIQAKLID